MHHEHIDSEILGKFALRDFKGLRESFMIQICFSQYPPPDIHVPAAASELEYAYNDQPPHPQRCPHMTITDNKTDNGASISLRYTTANVHKED